MIRKVLLLCLSFFCQQAAGAEFPANDDLMPYNRTKYTPNSVLSVWADYTPFSEGRGGMARASIGFQLIDHDNGNIKSHSDLALSIGYLWGMPASIDVNIPVKHTPTQQPDTININTYGQITDYNGDTSKHYYSALDKVPNGGITVMLTVEQSWTIYGGWSLGLGGGLGIGWFSPSEYSINLKDYGDYEFDTDNNSKALNGYALETDASKSIVNLPGATSVSTYGIGGMFYLALDYRFNAGGDMEIAPFLHGGVFGFTQSESEYYAPIYLSDGVGGYLQFGAKLLL